MFCPRDHWAVYKGPLMKKIQDTKKSINILTMQNEIKTVIFSPRQAVCFCCSTLSLPEKYK